MLVSVTVARAQAAFAASSGAASSLVYVRPSGSSRRASKLSEDGKPVVCSSGSVISRTVAPQADAL